METLARHRRVKMWGGVALLLSIVFVAGYLFRIIPTSVPDVRGLTEEQAWGRLSEHGLTTVSTSYSPDSTSLPGLVISQAPTSGSFALRRTTVHLVVSGSPPS